MFVTAATLATAGYGCGGDGHRVQQVGQPDQPTGQSIAIDEAALMAEVDGNQLRVTIPIQSREISSAGDLRVALVSVDGSRTFTQTTVGYRLGAGTPARLQAQLNLPTAIAAQADWVDYNLRIERAGSAELRLTRSLLSLVAPYEVRLEGSARVTRGRPSTFRVRTQDPLTFRSLAGVPVELVVKQGDAIVATHKGSTSDQGDAAFTLALDLEGEVKVEARAALQGTSAVAADALKVDRPGGKVLLTTDKPIYQPGQTVHLRALAIDRATQLPITGQPVLFQIADGKANKIFRRTLTSDAHGIAATQFKLGSVLNLGTFKVEVAVGLDRSEKTITVGRYVLPKFKVDVAAERASYLPGETVGGTIDARYFFGKPVAGAAVTVEASALDIGVSLFNKVVGRTDDNGRFSYAVELPQALVGLPVNQGSALVTLRATVEDQAGQRVEQERAITVASKPLRLALIPEGTALVRGLENKLDLFVTNPTGDPVAGAAVELTVADATQVGTTDGDGHASFTVTPGPPNPHSLEATVEATTKEGLVVREAFLLSSQIGGTPVLVRTDRAVYALGDKVEVTIHTDKQRKSVYVDWSNGGQTVDMRTVPVSDGVAQFTATIDPGLLGPSRIEAYVVGPDGNLVRGGRNIFARKGGALSVELTTDQPQYTPGAPARLTFAVKDETGAPAVAALGVQIVDEAIFALVDARPGLLKTYFELEDEFAKPSYQLRAPTGDLGSCLLTDTASPDPVAARAAQIRAAASLAALGGGGMMGIARGSWPAVTSDVVGKLAPRYEAARKSVIPVVRDAVNRAASTLGRRGCSLEQYYCQPLNKPYAAALLDEAAQGLKLWDFWGNAYRPDTSNFALRLTSDGPDEKAGTGDDGGFTVQLSELGLAWIDNARGPGNPNNGNFAPGGGAVADPAPPMAASPPNEGSASAGSNEPRVRKDFPETLYVNPQLITGPDGKAQVTLDMADSITEWRVSSLAHTAGGKLGGGLGAIRVFQDFFVDVDFPATLTRGDEVDFPVAVYNYLDKPQTVRLDLEAAPWYVARGATTATLNLLPGQVTSVRFPVRVLAVGRQTLTVKGLGGQRSDAVARTVLVEPDGKAFPAAQSGALSADVPASHTVSFPATAVPGSQRLHVDVFPAFLAQVVTGMDSLLRVPNGCFEQTTSTAWPNVLVTDYLKQTNQLKPEVALKAESLMSAGYQRLLTFEHKGGGFSWFGEQDPRPYLSVTAFGLMEFADMAKVHTVDPAMIERTRRWVVAQQSADGSWKGDMSEFFSFHQSLLRNTAFVIWALAAAGNPGSEVERGLRFIKQQMNQEKLDAYSLAMVANAFAAAAPGDPTGSSVLDQLEAQKVVSDKGDKISWTTGGLQTSFYGGGADAQVTTTALVTHAMLLAGRAKPTIDGALAFLTSSRDAQGNFGSTQATIWTLRTLLLASRKGTQGANGSFAVEVDGQPFTTLSLTPDEADVMTTVDLGALASTGSHQVTLRFSGTGKPSYNLVAQHHVPWSAVPGDAPGALGVSISYDKTSLQLDDTATATVVVRNNTDKQQDMVMVTVGLPPGFELLSEDLDRYKSERKLSRYDVTGKQVILYMTSLPAAGAQTFVYRLRATMPVKAADGGAVAYLYYQPEQRATAAGTTLQVVP